MRLIFISLTFFSSMTWAQVNCGPGATFPEELSITSNKNQSIDMQLNGVGLMRVFFIKIFYGALYLEAPSSNPQSIINSDQHKVGMIHFLRDVSRRRMVDLWDREFERLCGGDCDRLQPFHDRFTSYIRDMKKNEQFYIIDFPDRFEVEINAKETFPAIKSPSYSRLLQRSLFGPDAANDKLKKGLLGQDNVCRGLALNS